MDDSLRIWTESLQIARTAEIGTAVLVNGRTSATITGRPDFDKVAITYASGDTTVAGAKVWAEMGLVK